MRIASEKGLILFGGDATDAFAPSPAPNNTYLIDDDSVDQYKSKFDWNINFIQQVQSFVEYYNSVIYSYICWDRLWLIVSFLLK